MKKTAFLKLGLAMSLSLAALSACDQQTAPAPKTVQGTQKASADRNTGYPDIYQLLPKTSLSGVTNPNMGDRSNIKKALPKTPKDPKKIVIGWSEITLDNPWFVNLIDSAKKMAEKYGYEVKVQVAGSKLEKQSQAIDSFITQGVDILVVNPTDVLGVASDIKHAVEAGIPVIAVGTAPDSSAPVITTINQSSYSNGFEAGKYVAEQYKNEDPINAALIIGVMGNATSESRLNGMIGGIIYGRMQKLGKTMSKEEAMLRGYYLFEQIKKSGKFDDPETKFSVLGIGTGNWTEEGGLKAAEDLLAANASKLNIILADNDFMGMGALKALGNINKKGEIKVACSSDGTREALELIKSGELLVTGPYNSAQLGVETIQLIHKIFAEGFDANNMPLETHLQSGAITKDNVDQYYDPDKSNPFFKYQPIEFKTIPEVLKDLKAKTGS